MPACARCHYLSRRNVRFYYWAVPKVSDAHLAARREQILDAAVRRFAVEGFHQTSMADVIAESGMSAGAVYRYFRSKDELIEAAADRVLTAAQSTFAGLLADDAVPTPAEAVATVVAMADRIAGGGDIDISRVAVQAWSEALRNERVHATAAHAYGMIRAHFVEVARRNVAAGRLPAGTDPQTAGQVLFALVPGYLLQRLVLRDVDPASYGEGASALLG